MQFVTFGVSNMKVHLGSSNLLVKNCIVLSTFLICCASMCQKYFANEYEVICISKDNEKTSLYEKMYTKLMSDCYGFQVYHHKFPHGKKLHFVSEDCHMKTRGLEPFMYLDVQTFSTGRGNPSSILKNYVFAGVCNVNRIALSSANIETIEPHAFHCVNRTQLLDLTYNRIEILPPTIFEDMPELKLLNLSWNRIKILEKGLFDNLQKLEGIQLNSNLISVLPEKIFSPLQALQVLNLAENEIENLGYFPFSNCSRLQILSLGDNKLKSLEDTFRENTQMKVFIISNNEISSVSEQVFAEMGQLQKLYMANNQLERITPEVFGSLRKLSYLDLAFNKITELKDEPFQNNTFLSYLDLRSNNLTEISSSSLRGLQSLQTLVLISNSITSMAIDSFKHTPVLTYLLFDFNPLPSIPTSLQDQGGIFSNTSVLLLSMSDNKLRNLSNVFHGSRVLNLILKRNVGLILRNDTFAGLIYLISLNLEECDITSIPDRIFMETPKLQYIKLCKNRIHAITPDPFANLNIRELDLSNNRITKLNSRSLANNTRLNFLNISHNNILEIDEEAFVGTSLQHLDVSSNVLQTFSSLDLHLRYLRIGNNSITSLDGIFGVNEKLFYLSIESNNLSVITVEQWSRLFRMNTFIAKNNKIQEVFIPEIINADNHPEILLQHNNVGKIYIPSNIQSKNDKSIEFTKKTIDPELLVKIYLSDNPIECDCFAYPLYTYLINFDRLRDYVSFENDFICHQPLRLQGRKLRDLSPTELSCNYVDGCSYFQCTPLAHDCMDNCSCLYQPHGEFRSVNCSNKGFENLPSDVPKYTNLLDVSHNDISSVTELNRSLWENLTEIHLESNAIDSAEFVFPNSVVFLGLKDNKLTSFPISVQKQAERREDFKVSLSGNMWPCDCSILPLKEFLLAHENKVLDMNNITCLFANGSVADMTAMTYSDLCPSLIETEIPIVVYVVGGLTILASVALSVFYYNYKLYILAFIYTHCNVCYRLFCCDKQIDDDKIFDGFIAYSSEDLDVALGIIEELEPKPPKFSFCIHERNWMPGSLITNNIIYSVRNSRKTLVVLSETFLASQWFQLEFDAAFNQTLRDRQDRLILILKGKLPNSSDLPDNVRYVLKTKTYLQWGERWFFEKLRYALHEQKLFVSRSETEGFLKTLNCFRQEEVQQQVDIELAN